MEIIKILKQIEARTKQTSTKDTQEYGCNCNNGYVFSEVDGYMVASMCECLVKKLNEEMINKSGLVKVLGKYTFNKYATKEKHQQLIKDLALDYAKNGFKSGNWFFIGGQSGAGKTHICTAICNELMIKGNRLKYVVANSVLAEIKANAMDAEVYWKLIGKLTSPTVLYIDDLFKSKNITDADVKVLFEVINTRYNSNKVTIISSEKTINDLEKYDELEAVTGRIIEKAGRYVINLAKDSKKNYRKRNFTNI